MSTKKHIDIIVSHLLKDDDTQALRYYCENRVSLSQLNEAMRKATALKRLKNIKTIA